MAVVSEGTIFMIFAFFCVPRFLVIVLVCNTYHQGALEDLRSEKPALTFLKLLRFP